MEYNIKIMGDGFISSGQYDTIKIMGDTKSSGNVAAKEVTINGSAEFSGDCDFKKLKINGDTKVKGSLKSEYVKINGDLKANDDCEIDTLIVRGCAAFNCNVKCNNVTIYGDTTIKGNLYAKEIKIYGQIKVDKDIECENIVIDGAIECEGLINAEDIQIYLSGSSYCNELGAGSVTVLKHNKKSILKFLSFASLSRKRFSCKTIESDYIKLENCDITNIRGKQVDLLSNCNVENIEYNQNLNISKNSAVKNHTKVC